MFDSNIHHNAYITSLSFINVRKARENKLKRSGVQRKGGESDCRAGGTDPQREVQQPSAEETSDGEPTGKCSPSAENGKEWNGEFAAEEKDELVAAEASTGTLKWRYC